MKGKLTLSQESVTTVSVILTLKGDMVAGDSALIEAECKRCMEEGKVGVVVDMTEVGSLTSSGLGAVAELARVLKIRNGRVVVAAPEDSEAGKLIVMLGLREALGLVGTALEGRRLVVGLK